MKKDKQKIVVIAGATASGKSDFAIKFAAHTHGEIIGADSVQIYKGLNIGSGKITFKEMCGIPHHMIDILEPSEEYSVSDYVKATKIVIDDIANRGKLPIVVGGTGLYIKCLLEGHNFGDAQKDEALRERLKKELADFGKEFIFERLKKVDPQSAEKISINDTKRVIRALEIFELTGLPKSTAIKTQPESEYDFRMFVLNRDRTELYSKINQRVDVMFESGLIEEVATLMDYKNCQAMQSIGYKEVVEYLCGARGLDETKELIKMNTRRYAKRQLTFFRGMNFEKQWLDASNPHVMSDII